MGYDYGNGYVELYTSYNHGYYFYKYLDEEKGLRFIYGKRGRDVLPFLMGMASRLRGSPAWTHNYCQIWEELSWDEQSICCLGWDDEGNVYDGWYPSIGNAYWFLQKIIEACIEYPMEIWDGD